MCKDLENRLEKEVATAKKMESFIHEINGQYNQLNQDYTAKKKELQEANESLLKERKKVSDAKVLQDMIDGKLSELTNENEQYRDREK